MGLYAMTNVPVNDDNREIEASIAGENICFRNVDKRDRDNVFKTAGIATIFVGDHMFEPERRTMLREMYGRDVVYALERGIELGYAKAKADIRNALGIHP